ncbi:hypothetical protein RPALISO_14 [Ruegeria phage RpAliso]|nr:hypothetical protein RPALISO_14 [Ruegeria phage RpAliso]
MTIHRIACSPADIGMGGYTFSTVTTYFDPTRVTGAFYLNEGDSFTIGHDAPVGDEMWYHFRYGQTNSSFQFYDTDTFYVNDGVQNRLATLFIDAGKLRVRATGDTSFTSGDINVGANNTYSIDVHVIVNDSVTVRLYINSALYFEGIVANTGGRGKPTSAFFLNNYDGSYGYDQYFSEIVIADEDTRGMRVREMRPQSLGIYQEWDGDVNSMRDEDTATGMSTALPARRVSFGVSNVENVGEGDIINRVVAQTYAQRGETGIESFQHFFRFRNGDVVDGASIPVGLYGQFYVEEFVTNPQTGLAWSPEDFRSLQTGLVSGPLP